MRAQQEQKRVRGLDGPLELLTPSGPAADLGLIKPGPMAAGVERLAQAHREGAVQM